MTPRTWAEKKVTEYELNVPDIGRMIYKETGVALLMAEHARSVRIVEGKDKWLLGGGYANVSNDFQAGYHQAYNDILAAPQRGRTERGE